ncbi:hypothetical protein [Maribacter sp. 2210JD10-5]|uniref:hypothetical protein n=1 Tax=Maribacter sp. 2210JD10-5 TaxID=3386272 RepID=UPI0039BD3298
MIGTILKILSKDKFYGISKEIEIAKGANKLPETFSDVLKQAKRRLKAPDLYKT